MVVFLIPGCFILTFLSLGISGIASTKKEVFISTVLAFSLFVLAGTEMLSAIHSLSYTALLIYWLLILFAEIGYLYVKRDELSIFNASLKTEIRGYIADLSIFEKICVAILLVLLAMIFVQGVLYPPTNWDSMTYHLARITSWVGHRSVAYYPTDITRQLYQPPFAEYVIMHFNLLSRSDYFSALVQFLFLVFSLVAVNGITSLMGLNRQTRLFAMIVAATIPEAVLQASSTQNDVVEGFFILASFYFMLKAITAGQRKYFVLLGIAAGFSLFTKGTGYVYLSPLLLVFGIIMLIRLIKTRNYSLLPKAMLALSFIVVINSGYYIRNYKLAHNFLGVDKTEARTYSNERMNPALLSSVIVKNAALHMEVMFAKKVSFWADSGITQLHRAAHIDINDPAVNYRGMSFGLETDVTNEENAPNPFHFLLIIVSIIIAIACWKRTRENKPAFWLLVILLLQILLFCTYLKWQPWNSRLHTPVFMLAVPFVAYAFNISSKLFKLNYLIAPLLLVYALLVSLHNDARPVNDKMLSGARYPEYFTNKLDAYHEYNAINNQLKQNDLKNIGLILGVDDWEYPLFTECYSKSIVPVYIAVDNISRCADSTKRPVDCIVSTKINIPFIDYNKRRYYNQDKGNKIIFLYK